MFYLRMPEGKGVEDLVLISLEHKGELRMAEFGPNAKKQELKPDAIRHFDSVEVAAQLFRLTESKLTEGEYMYLQTGSADPSKGNAGKGYDFGVDPATPSGAQ